MNPSHGSDPHAHGSHGGGADAKSHANPLKFYIGIFVALTIVTAVEMLPLFEIVNLPAPVLLAFSAVKFVVVCAFFMHLWGDHPIYTRLFFIPLGMVVLTIGVLMALFNSWTLTYQHTSRGSDSDAVAARYRSVWEGDCNAWVKSPFTGNEYCSSPNAPINLMATYDALKPSKAADPRFEGFDAKSAEEQQAVLMAVGQEVYAQNCQACHMSNGEGNPALAPSLIDDAVVDGAGADHITVVLKGMSGKVIKGVAYAGAMPPWAQLTNEQIAAVVTYERHSWGNNAGKVTPAEVAALR